MAKTRLDVALVERGLTLPALAVVTQSEIHAIIPNASAISNPVDSGGGTDPRVEYCGSISQAILEDPNVDALLIVGFSDEAPFFKRDVRDVGVV